MTVDGKNSTRSTPHQPRPAHRPAAGDGHLYRAGSSSFPTRRLFTLLPILPAVATLSDTRRVSGSIEQRRGEGAVFGDKPTAMLRSELAFQASQCVEHASARLGHLASNRR